MSQPMPIIGLCQWRTILEDQHRRLPAGYPSLIRRTMVQITQVSMTVTPRICERWFWRDDVYLIRSASISSNHFKERPGQQKRQGIISRPFPLESEPWEGNTHSEEGGRDKKWTTCMQSMLPKANSGRVLTLRIRLGCWPLLIPTSSTSPTANRANLARADWMP